MRVETELNWGGFGTGAQKSPAKPEDCYPPSAIATPTIVAPNATITSAVSQG